MPTLIEAITTNPNAKAFRRVKGNGDDPCAWQFDAIVGDVVVESGQSGFYILGATNVLADHQIRRCYMDISLPERINDYAYFFERDELRYDRTRNFEGEIIPAIAINCFGFYELFYSKTLPEIGIEVLKRGLAASKRKHVIAQDLGYIFRDEGRYREAAEMFQLAVDEEVSSYFVYDELAQAYGKIGDLEKQAKYAEVFKRHERRKP